MGSATRSLYIVGVGEATRTQTRHAFLVLPLLPFSLCSGQLPSFDQQWPLVSKHGLLDLLCLNKHFSLLLDTQIDQYMHVLARVTICWEVWFVFASLSSLWTVLRRRLNGYVLSPDWLFNFCEQMPLYVDFHAASLSDIFFFFFLCSSTAAETCFHLQMSLKIGCVWLGWSCWRPIDKVT